MRSRARLSVLLAGLLLLALPAMAAAEPHPIQKPSTTIGPIQPAKQPTHTTPPAKTTPPAGSSSSSISSSTGSSTGSTGSSGTTGSTGSTGSTGTNPGTGTVSTGTTIPAKVVVATSEGGRDQSGIAVPAPPPPEPTPLAVVPAGDKVTSPGTSTPAWKIALLALLAAAEAFLLVRLVRDRPRELSPA